MKEKILECLRGQEDYVSGQKICQMFGVSRTAVWKYIKMLREEGYEIDSVTRKGYRLLASPDRLEEGRIRKLLPEGFPTGELVIYESIDSTNEAAKRAAASGAADGSVYLAETQTRGKGRRGRTWSSPGGEDLFFTMLQIPDLSMDMVSMVTLVAAYAASVTVGKYVQQPVMIKWPNDIILNKKKICGILTEMGGEMDRISFVAIGIGFNLNRMEFEEEIASMASSIRKETGLKVDREAFFVDYYTNFQKYYHIFLQEKSLSFMMEEYNARLFNIGRQVRILDADGQKVRKARGINNRGELIVEDEHGNTEHIFSGEVSVRGLYGYV